MQTRIDVTISLPCYRRPQRTIRAIESILNQVGNYNVELLLTVDGDPDLYQHISDYLKSKCVKFSPHKEFFQEYEIYYNYGSSIHKQQGLVYCDIVHANFAKQSGFWGTHIRNTHINLAAGEYFIFMGSDDVLEPNHLENYLSFIKGTSLDFAAFDSYVEPYKAVRNTQFQNGMIGHSELIVRTKFLRLMPKHEPYYGHDWVLVHHMMEAAGPQGYKKAVGRPPTYIVKSVPGNVEQGID